MGYYIEYTLRLTILGHDVHKALEIFNQLHTDEMLVKYAKGGSFPRSVAHPINEQYWYSWVNNPTIPYTTLTEAFNNWGIVEDACCLIDAKTGNFTVGGCYNNKWGQQDFLIQQLAPILSDTTINVICEDGNRHEWSITNHQFFTKMNKE